MTRVEPLIAEALALAKQCTNWTAPNPRVGCVIVAPEGVVLGRGNTQAAGSHHAEIMALRDAQVQGQSVTGAIAYVTLEPCSHHGRTGPCCDALIAAGIKRVVAANTDPNPMVAGQGFARLRTAGVAVEVLAVDDPLAIQSRELNIGFFSRMVRKTPWVRMKIAASLDGKTALDNGNSQWITSPEARADGHAWRARACAILTGIGTILQDKPSMDVRLAQTNRQPHLIIVDSNLQTPPESPVFLPSRKIFIYAATRQSERQLALEARGATVIHQPGTLPDGTLTGQVDLKAMLTDLGRREVNELHVEAGHRLNGALIWEGLVDELLVYLAPKLLGQGRDMASLRPLHDLSDALQLDFTSTTMVGPDLRVLARVRGRDVF